MWSSCLKIPGIFCVGYCQGYRAAVWDKKSPMWYPCGHCSPPWPQRGQLLVSLDKQISTMTSEEGSLKRTAYGKMLPEAISSRVLGELRVQADKGASTPLLLCLFTWWGWRRKGRAASSGAGVWVVQGKIRGHLPCFSCFPLARALIVFPFNFFFLNNLWLFSWRRWA